MSTKNLARTVIEGGRRGWSKQTRRDAAGRERGEWRHFLTWTKVDDEFFDALPTPRRKRSEEEFTDKLSPMYRWLDRQVGRPWAKINAELREKFDTRTTAGRHIVYDHLLREVFPSGFFFQYRTYFLDKHGILRKVKKKTTKQDRSGRNFESKKDWLSAVAKFIGPERKVGKRGDKWFWFVAATKMRRLVINLDKFFVTLRQDRELTDKELAEWEVLFAERQFYWEKLDKYMVFEVPASGSGG